MNTNNKSTARFTLNNDWQKQNCKIIAFVQDDKTFKISGATQSALK